MAFKMLGSLALLMFGMKSMSEALQKMAGPQLRRVLGIDVKQVGIKGTTTEKLGFAGLCRIAPA